MSGIYAVTTQAIVTGGFNWTSGNYALMLVGPGYTPDYENHTVLTDIPAGARLLASPLALSGETAVNGFCRAANASWAALTTTAAVQGVAILKDNGDTTFTLVAYIDQGEGFGQVANNVPANVIWDTRGIFRP